MFKFEYLKNTVLVLGIIIVASLAYRYYDAYKDAAEKIATAESQEAQMRADNEKLQQKISDLDAKQKVLEQQITVKEKEIDEHLATIDEIGKKLKEVNFKTIAQTSEQAIADDFKKTYHELKDMSNVKVIKVPEAPNAPWKESVLQIPIDYVKLTITAKNTKDACLKQSALKDQVIGLNNSIRDLQDQNLSLEKEKSAAYQQGYDKAFAMYLDANEKYIELLKVPPKIDFAPSWLEIAGGLAGGIALCAL